MTNTAEEKAVQQRFRAPFSARQAVCVKAPSARFPQDKYRQQADHYPMPVMV